VRNVGRIYYAHSSKLRGPMAIQSGTHLGPYEILSAIGAGGMGEVYRARDPKLGRDVAIKVLPEAFARDADRMARFQREAKVLASLSHPNIATIYGLEDSGATHALVMELVEGPTLADRIKAGPIPIDEAIRIARQIADALEYAHERGIIHRDLKPANVKVTNDDTVKVLDFGLAKALEGDPSSIDISTSPTISRMATQAGVLLGTAAYMAPEQAKAKTMDRRADIWAFGCVLYEMLTGRQAFTGETVTDTLASIIKEEPDWSSLPAATPMRVRVLLQRCLQKDPRLRLRDIGDARISLDEVIAGAPDPTVTGRAAISAPLWPRALPWALLGVTAIALAAISWLYLAVTNAHAPPAPVQRLELMAPEQTPAWAQSTAGSVASLSPDGALLVFFEPAAGGTIQLWARRMDSLDAHPVKGTEGAEFGFPFWSPDGRFVAFGTADGKLKKIDTEGGPAQVLCDAGAAVLGGFWTPDGKIVFSGIIGGDDPNLFEVPASGGTATPLGITRTSGREGNISPVLLPDRQHFIFVRAKRLSGGKGEIHLASLNDMARQQSTSKLLTRFSWNDVAPPAVAFAPSSDNPNVGYLLFTGWDGNNPGTLLAQAFDLRKLVLTGEPLPFAEGVSFGGFSASSGILAYRGNVAGGRFQLTWFDRQGKVLGTAGEPGFVSEPALSPDGKRVAVLRTEQPRPARGNLWLVDSSQGTITRFTFGNSGLDSFPIWTPDGGRILFTSTSGGPFDLYQKPASGAGDETLLLKSSESKYPSSVSRDGRFLLYSANDLKTKYDLWILPLKGDEKPFPFLRTEFNELDGHFSPDGHWVAYSSDESGRYEVYVRRFTPQPAADGSDTGGKWQLSYGGAHWPRWSADGKDVYYLTPDSKVMVVDVSTSPIFQVGTPKLVFQAPRQPQRTSGDYTVDGKRFLLLAPTEQTAQAPFTVVLNWQTALKK